MHEATCVQVFHNNTKCVLIQGSSLKLLSFRKQIDVLDLAMLIYRTAFWTSHKTNQKTITYQSRTKQHHDPQMPSRAWSTSSARNLLKLPRISEDAWRNCQMSSSQEPFLHCYWLIFCLTCGLTSQTGLGFWEKSTQKNLRLWHVTSNSKYDLTSN